MHSPRHAAASWEEAGNELARTESPGDASVLRERNQYCEANWWHWGHWPTEVVESPSGSSFEEKGV